MNTLTINTLTPLTETSQTNLKLLEPRRLVEVLVQALDQSNAARSDCGKAGIELANFCIGGEAFNIAHISEKDELYEALANGSGLNLLQNTFRCVVSQLDQDFRQRDGGERYLCHTLDFAKAAGIAVNTLSKTPVSYTHLTLPTSDLV